VRNVNDALKQLLHSRRWSRPSSHMDTTASPIERATLPDEHIDRHGEPRPTPTKQARWEAVRERRSRGQSLHAIATALGMNRKTVRRYLAADHPPVYGPRRPRPTKLTPHLSYLRERWVQGCHNARRLYRELVGRGYTGSESQVRTVLGPWRSAQAPPPRRAPPLHWLVLRPSRRLTSSQKDDLEQVLEANPVLVLGYHLKESFHTIMAQQDVRALDHWLQEAAASQLAPFQAVARSFRQDYDAVKLAFTTPWSTAQCEGQICRVKLIKRLGYGRAKLDLLRQRILHRVASR
jgi:transposase